MSPASPNGSAAIGRTATEPHERSVLDRYARGAAAPEAALCCPACDYDPSLLENIPEEILAIDYGCGDPSQYVDADETVLDLGSGSGKICYILAQKVGAAGQVIGVDFNDAMLDLARKYQDEMSRRLGYANTSFHKARIQDLALDLDLAQQWIQQHPLRSVEDLVAFEAECDRLRRAAPMIKNDSIDVIVSNCVLNLVRPADKQMLFQEMFRVLRKGGRCVISDIVCDEDPTPRILNDPDLWSGCIAGAFREDQFLTLFEQAGFHGVEILSRAEQPWRTIDGIEFRSMTVRAFKGKHGPCIERKHAVVYRGPWKTVHDDDGHVLCRGERMAVCEKTYRLLTDPNGPYAGEVIGIEPHEAVPDEAAVPFDCRRAARRHPRETKGLDYYTTTDAPDDCCPNGSCC